MDKFTVYGDLNSGNCLKVKYVADYLGFTYDWVAVDILKSETQSERRVQVRLHG